MQTGTYNGWTNYETWVVNLWMDNEEGLHDFWVNKARHVYNHEAKQQRHFSKMEDAVCIMAHQLKDSHEEVMNDMLESRNLTSSVWSDLLGGALAAANWHEIARHLLENVEDET